MTPNRQICDYRDMIDKVLIVDDEPLMLKFMKEALLRKDKDITLAENGLIAIEKIRKEPFDLIISDIKMPHKSGLEVLEAAKKWQPQALVILATAFGTIESAVEAMRFGAFYYLIKPFSIEVLEAALEKAEEHFRIVKENRFLKEENIRSSSKVIAESPSMKKLLTDLGKIAKAQASVFITGESGTGKEVIAAAIHELSPRKTAPFIKVNCAAIPEALVESEFFGHERGAFTHAVSRKIGRFELADRGTLLLDEVTEIPLGLQAKLLRAIQEQEFERVGGAKPLHVNVRFIATSNRNMQEAIETKVFREDLFYRLNVIPIHIPPLRERKEDILPLVDHFLLKFCSENHKAKKRLTEKAVDKLLNYPWPGNVRELANIIERTVVLDFEDLIDAEHLYLDTAPSLKKESGGFFGMSLHEMEKRMILETLAFHHQNRTKAASTLGISIRTLRNKLQEYEETP